MGLAHQVGPQDREKKYGTGQGSEYAGPQSPSLHKPAQAGPDPQAHIKKLPFLYKSYFFIDSCIPNSRITGKNKYYVFFNVLKFKEYIVYVIVWIWIWWKCKIINLSPKSLLNFVNFLSFPIFKYWKFYHKN